MTDTRSVGKIEKDVLKECLKQILKNQREALELGYLYKLSDALIDIKNMIDETQV